MTTNQALKEAKRRWGNKAIIHDNKRPHLVKSGAVLSGQFDVGRSMMGFFEVLGSGPSWEHAFALSSQYTKPQ